MNVLGCSRECFGSPNPPESATSLPKTKGTCAGGPWWSLPCRSLALAKTRVGGALKCSRGRRSREQEEIWPRRNDAVYTGFVAIQWFVASFNGRAKHIYSACLDGQQLLDKKLSDENQLEASALE